MEEKEREDLGPTLYDQLQINMNFWKGFKTRENAGDLNATDSQLLDFYQAYKNDTRPTKPLEEALQKHLYFNQTFKLRGKFHNQNYGLEFAIKAGISWEQFTTNNEEVYRKYTMLRLDPHFCGILERKWIGQRWVVTSTPQGQALDRPGLAAFLYSEVHRDEHQVIIAHRAIEIDRDQFLRSDGQFLDKYLVTEGRKNKFLHKPAYLTFQVGVGGRFLYFQHAPDNAVFAEVTSPLTKYAEHEKRWALEAASEGRPKAASEGRPKAASEGRPKAGARKRKRQDAVEVPSEEDLQKFGVKAPIELVTTDPASEEEEAGQSENPAAALDVPRRKPVPSVPPAPPVPPAPAQKRRAGGFVCGTEPPQKRKLHGTLINVQEEIVPAPAAGLARGQGGDSRSMASTPGPQLVRRSPAGGGFSTGIGSVKEQSEAAQQALRDQKKADALAEAGRQNYEARRHAENVAKGMTGLSATTQPPVIKQRTTLASDFRAAFSRLFGGSPALPDAHTAQTQLPEQSAKNGEIVDEYISSDGGDGSVGSSWDSDYDSTGETGDEGIGGDGETSADEDSSHSSDMDDSETSDADFAEEDMPEDYVQAGSPVSVKTDVKFKAFRAADSTHHGIDKHTPDEFESENIPLDFLDEARAGYGESGSEHDDEKKYKAADDAVALARRSRPRNTGMAESGSWKRFMTAMGEELSEKEIVAAQRATEFLTARDHAAAGLEFEQEQEKMKTNKRIIPVVLKAEDTPPGIFDLMDKNDQNHGQVVIFKPTSLLFVPLDESLLSINRPPPLKKDFSMLEDMDFEEEQLRLDRLFVGKSSKQRRRKVFLAERTERMANETAEQKERRARMQARKDEKFQIRATERAQKLANETPAQKAARAARVTKEALVAKAGTVDDHDADSMSD